MRFSVIIPAYNAEKTIERCLNSILCSDRQDLEVLLINDGSTDDTGSICQRYAQKDCRVRYFEKENGGVSSARNLGLTHARGELVSFVDSDDYVESDYFKQIDKNMSAEDDLLIFGITVFDGVRQSIPKMCKGRYWIREDSVSVLAKALRKRQLNAPFNKVYRLDRIRKEKISFPENLQIGEDKVFTVKYLMGTKCAHFIKKTLYVFSVENPYSLSQKPRPDLSSSILLEHEMMHEAIAQADLSEKCKAEYHAAISYSLYRSAYTAISEIDKFNLPSKEKTKRAKEICREFIQNGKKYRSDIYARLISIPIRFEMISMIELIRVIYDRMKYLFEC